MDVFAKRLKAMRKDNNLSLDLVVFGFKEKFNVNITKSHLSRWENGKTVPSVVFAGYLAKFYGVSVDYLLGFTDSRVPTDLLAQAKSRKEKDNK